MKLGNGSFWSTIVQGAELAVGASLALGVIKMVADVLPIPRGFVLANVGETMNTLSPTGEVGRYDLS